MKTASIRLPALALAALALVSIARAEDAPSTPPPPAAGEQRPPRMDPKKMREHRMQMLDGKLQLTADQKQKINAIWDKSEEQGRALRADESLSRDDRRAKAAELMKATHADVRAVLTADQQKIFDTLPQDRPMRRGPRAPGGDAPPPPPPAQ